MKTTNDGRDEYKTIVGAGCMFATGWAVVTLAAVSILAYTAIRIWG
jgi:hypothetical protein